MTQVRYAIVGSTGVIGETHIDAIEKTANAVLVGVSAVRPGPLRAQAAELNVRAYASVGELVDDGDVDVVVIATPHPSHLSITLRAAEAGKHVLTEKPMGATVTEAASMLEATKKAGVRLGVLYQNRFRPECLKARSLIDQGALGDIYRVSMVHATARTQSYYESRPWRGTWGEEGGGVLLNQAIHSLDLLQWLAGMPKSVFGMLATLKHRIEVEDYATALFEYENGAQGTVHCNTVQSPNEVEVEMWGEKGSILLSDQHLVFRRNAVPISRFMETDDPSTSARLPCETEVHEFERLSNAHVPAFEDFTRAIIEGREPYITGEDGIKSQELAGAITLSGCTKEKVSIPIDGQAYDALLQDLKARQKLL
jgi:predicted dehydrogenase